MGGPHHRCSRFRPGLPLVVVLMGWGMHAGQSHQIVMGRARAHTHTHTQVLWISMTSKTSTTPRATPMCSRARRPRLRSVYVCVLVPHCNTRTRTHSHSHTHAHLVFKQQINMYKRRYRNTQCTHRMYQFNELSFQSVVLSLGPGP